MCVRVCVCVNAIVDEGSYTPGILNMLGQSAKTSLSHRWHEARTITVVHQMSFPASTAGSGEDGGEEERRVKSDRDKSEANGG